MYVIHKRSINSGEKSQQENEAYENSGLYMEGAAGVSERNQGMFPQLKSRRLS